MADPELSRRFHAAHAIALACGDLAMRHAADLAGDRRGDGGGDGHRPRLNRRTIKGDGEPATDGGRRPRSNVHQQATGAGSSSRHLQGRNEMLLTTALRLLADLELSGEGRILLGGDDVTALGAAGVTVA